MPDAGRPETADFGPSFPPLQGIKEHRLNRLQLLADLPHPIDLLPDGWTDMAEIKLLSAPADRVGFGRHDTNRP